MAAPAATAAANKVLVVGGTGFLGFNVCRVAAMKGWDVVSLSRRGEPSAFRTHGKPDWAKKVTWASADSLNPATYVRHLPGTRTVVHTVGILMETDYKRVVRAQSLGEAMEGIRAMLGDRGNPLKRRGDIEGVGTFEKMNRDTAIAIAREAARIPTIDSFVYVSASDIFPLVNPRYITTKREAERFLFARNEFRTVVLRPGFMYSDNRPLTASVAAALSLANRVTAPIRRDVASLPFGSTITTPPLHIETVARAAMEAASREGLKGIFDAEEIAELAEGRVGV